MWKKLLVPALAAVLSLAASQAARAQGADQPAVKWTLQVLQNGNQVDSFDGTTAIGQSYTGTHERSVTHDIGCRNQPAAHIELGRTVTIAPLHADSTGAVTFALDAKETLEDNGTPHTVEGCKLPPQPRQIHATHPGLTVPAGQWASWQIIDKDPSLVYRLRASLVSATDNQ